jgi:hypothetical protein
VQTASTNASVLTGFQPIMRDVTRQLDRRPIPRHVVIDFVGTTRGGLYNGVIDELTRQGVTVYARANPGQSFGPQRSYRRGDRGTRWYVTEEGSLRGELLALPGAKIVAATSPLSAGQDAELTRLQSELGGQLDAAGQSGLRRYLDGGLIGFIMDKVPGIDHEALDRVSDLNGKVERSGRCRCAVVSVSRSAPNIGH